MWARFLLDLTYVHVSLNQSGDHQRRSSVTDYSSLMSNVLSNDIQFYQSRGDHRDAGERRRCVVLVPSQLLEPQPSGTRPSDTALYCNTKSWDVWGCGIQTSSPITRSWSSKHQEAGCLAQEFWPFTAPQTNVSFWNINFSLCFHRILTFFGLYLGVKPEFTLATRGSSWPVAAVKILHLPTGVWCRTEHSPGFSNVWLKNIILGENNWNQSLDLYQLRFNGAQIQHHGIRI